MSLYCKPVSRPCSPTSPTRTLSDTDIHDDLLDPHDFLHPLFSEFNPLDASPMYQHDIPSPYSSSLSAHDSSSSAASPSPKSQFEPLTTKAYALSNNHDNTKTASLADNYLFLTDYLVPETDNILLTDRPPSRRMEDTLDRPLQIRVLGVPNTGAKSRVETQIKLCIQLLTAKGTKVSCWSYLKLPEELLAKSRLRKNQQQQRVLDGSVASMISDESKVLSLEARVVCASDPDKTIRMCAGCVRREVCFCLF
ncbi:uncharacterized protein BYT42DRAFT_413220 [Radiomyces spectabilis]|uniref:uncharacterized protein n=1 Tax=Radiomyces spectabilis TaxID=64574 RepID=UPI002220F26F|nr:uncharacterized protein BYT42DRAFT_413220 [Radiomyces spectabilis]KAI8374610.1 hypothetical protein BYT42DRAFT_413220 [Radiomyces spectabilis]